MSPEQRLRDALHARAARVEVDHEAAWRRIAAAVERELPAAPRPVDRPDRRRSRVAAVLAGVTVVAVASAGFWLAVRDERAPRGASVGGAPTSAPAGAAPVTRFDELVRGDAIEPGEWAGAVRTLTAARGNLAGRVENAIGPGEGLPASTSISFAESRDGQLRLDDAGLSTVALADGTAVEVEDFARVVRVRSNGARDALSPEMPIGRALHPDRWVEAEAERGPATVVYEGRDAVDGRPGLQFSVRFTGQDATLVIDASTGVLLRSVVRTGDSEKQREETTVRDLRAATPLAIAARTLPAGYAIEATIDTPSGPRMVRGTVPAGATVGSVVEQVRAEAAR